MSGGITGADHVIAVDVGTQSVRALVFDPAGTLVAMAKVPIEPYVSPQPGWAEQDPELGAQHRREPGGGGAAERLG